MTELFKILALIAIKANNKKIVKNNNSLKLNLIKSKIAIIFVEVQKCHKIDEI